MNQSPQVSAAIVADQVVLQTQPLSDITQRHSLLDILTPHGVPETHPIPAPKVDPLTDLERRLGLPPVARR